MTVEEAYPLFLAYGRAERQYAKETLGKLKDCFTSWILPQLADQDLEALSHLDILSFRSKLVDAKLGINRQYSLLMALKLFFKFCRQVLKLNALDPNDIRLPQRPKPHVNYLTNEEVARLVNVIKTTTFTGLRMRALVEVLLTTGLRISEALSLDRTPFELGQTQVLITGKGGKPRTVFLPESTLSWIKRWLYYRTDDFPALFVTTGIPRRLDRGDLSKYFKELKARAGIDKPLTPHILRHTYCTNLLHNGADITFIKELAGHQDIQTTARYYLGVDQKALKGVVDKYLNYKSPSSLEGGVSAGGRQRQHLQNT
ncbi:MAG TPA: tyrosine-type recombinase/integrase [Clostridia bacterium]|nr:tyrosine-type recombinase/integrase [Clostridia bacterium]